MGGLHTSLTYVDLIYQALEADPGATAFVWDGGSMSYGEVAKGVSQVAQTLRASGLGKGDGIALLAYNDPRTFLIQAGALAAGCRYTPLHPLGSAADHATVIAESEVAAVFYEPGLFGARIAELDHAGALPAAVYSLGPGEVGEEFSYAHAPAIRPDVDLDENDLAFLPFTGGTTGTPKGVMLPHRVMVTNAIMTLAGWDIPHRPRFLACTPISHASGVIVTPILLAGGTIILTPFFTVDSFRWGLDEQGATMTFAVPTLLYALMDAGVDLSPLETIVYGAAPMSPTRLKEAVGRFGPIFMQLYAQTEAPNTVTALRRADHDVNDADRLISCGRPLPGVYVRLLDEFEREVPIGEVGEICVRGRLVMDGYWKNPDLTADTLRNGWLHTGDLARRDARGYLTIVDRKKDMIISGGFNVYPREVEDALAAHPAVGQVAVIGLPDERWGESVAAFVVLRPDATVDANELIAWAKERKGPVQAPKRVEFVDALPVTALGKPDKKALRSAHWAGSERQVN